MELVCSQGREELRSANSCDSLRTFEVAGALVEMLLLWACLNTPFSFKFT